MSHAALSAFQGVGIELEYMIVDEHDLRVRPLADRVLAQDAKPGHEPVHGELGWSNEFVRHVIELKNLRPTSSLAGQAPAFQAEIAAMEARLAPLGARLMPGAMHPWMNPRRQTRLWKLGERSIYRAYAGIFDCRTHGWANLQSMHVNLPFSGDAEFARLHAAIRALLPILPALAASSPLAEGSASGWMDTRLHVYAGNAPGFAEITGGIVPDTVDSRADYERAILQPMYRAIAPYDPARVLQHEWLNSRGAIARFERSAIEIRVLDTQECLAADLAVAAAVTAAVRLLYEAGSLAEQRALPTAMLAGILQGCIREADRSRIDDAGYLRLFGRRGGCSAGELWQGLLERLSGIERPHQAPLASMLRHGPLARRLLRAVDGCFERARLEQVYRTLCDCLREGRMFGVPDAERIPAR